MWDEQVPLIGRISHVDAGKDGKEVRLEGVDGMLGIIALVYVGQDKLVRAAPCVGDVAMVVCTGFVVEYASVDAKLSGTEACHDSVGSRNAVAVVFGGKWLDEYHIAGMVVMYWLPLWDWMGKRPVSSALAAAQAMVGRWS